MPMSLEDRLNICAICHQKAFGYNYDVVSCNACKMFFRRVHTEKIDETCKKGGRCFEGDDLSTTRPKCRPCRFQKCIKLGMRHHKSTDSEDKSSSDSEAPPKNSIAVPQTVVTQAHIDSTVFQQLYRLHDTRYKVYSVINIHEDPSFLDLVVREPKLGIYARPDKIVWENTERKLKPWGSLGVLLIAEVCKTMDVYNELLLSDRVLLLRNVAFKSHHLSIAWDSYSRKKGRVMAPTGDEMFPRTLFQIQKCREIIMELLTSPMQPFIDLKITEMEYLLLNAIMICNPGIERLSPSAQRILSHHQQKYVRILLQQCFISNPRTGPSRFMELLAICPKLNKQMFATHKLMRTLRDHYIEGLSLGGQDTLSRFQRVFVNVLLRQCTISNSKSGPSWFAAILSAIQQTEVLSK